MKYLSINPIYKKREPLLFLWLFFSIFSCQVVAQNLPFCSFRQLSHGKKTAVVEELKLYPALLKTEYLNLPIVDTFLSFKTWILNDSFRIEHKVPSYGLRLFRDSIADTLIINNQKYDLERIVRKPIVAIISKVVAFKLGSNNFLCFKVLNAGDGRILTCNLLIFNITDITHVVCLNELADVPGETWMVKENLITDLDNDGVLEVNLVDSLEVRPYLIYPSLLLKSDKHLVLRQVEDMKYCVDLQQSRWYFDIGKHLQECRICDFDFDEESQEMSY
ncbi:hypothetical protein [Chitinophaga sp.]|uniref:hypothetical protein n=1 Tax=Chitinophaga sp. TaxID=1869181 RepID=UPI0031E316ED